MILQGNTPDLLNGSLTPVIYDETISMWRVADLTDVWYDYEKQWWANAVILEEGIIKKTGDTIIVPTKDSTETEVRAMYVWVPRYSYTIKSEDGTNYYGKTLSDLGGSTASQATPGAIDIKFVNVSAKENGIPQYTGTTANNWLTHPAFTFGTKELTGIWVGKFEPSASISNDCYKDANEGNCLSSKVSPYILPNVKSLVYQNVSNQFATSQEFKKYLIDSTSVDSHMMKNSEWGAVAYLSQSIYGKYGNSLYTENNKEIYNNDSTVYTGRSSGYPSAGSGLSPQGQCYYDDIKDQGSGKGTCGAGASTTGNIYGVYDMSGGKAEYVMGYYTGANSNYTSSPNSYFGWTMDDNDAGFTFKPVDKYFDNYKTNAITTACNSGICYGHALSETNGWYGDTMAFVGKGTSWVTRGGSYLYPSEMGIFGVYSHPGSAGSGYSFRAVLVSEQ